MKVKKVDRPMSDGMIHLDSPRAELFGFTSERFAIGSYLWILGPHVVISAIESRAKGNFRELVERIQLLGFGVKIPTPLAEMSRIVRKCGYRHVVEIDPRYGPVDIWILDPPEVQDES